jgi:Tfp pilus assembly protein PilV
MQFIKKILKNEEGLSIIEVMVAVVFLVLTVGALIGLGITSVKRASSSAIKTVAYGLLEEGTEASRMIRDNANNYNSASHLWGVQKSSASWAAWNWDDIPDSSSPYYYRLDHQGNGWKLTFINPSDCTGGSNVEAWRSCYQNQTIDNVDYYRQIKISDYYPDAQHITTSKKVEVIVGWYDRTDFRQVSSSTVLTSWE